MDIQAYIQSGIIETSVLGLASAEETAELEKLKGQYPEVEQAILEFSTLIEQQAFENAVMPPAEVKAKVLSTIQPGNTVAPVITLGKNTSINANVSTKGFRFARILAAASVILFIASAGLNFYLYKRYNDKNEAYQALLTERNSLEANNQIYQTHLRQWQTSAEIMSNPAMAVIKMPGTQGREQHLATVYWDTRNKDVYVMANKLPEPTRGKQFQLWALVDGKPVDAGVLSPECEGVCKMKNIPKAQAFAITLENEGGSATPTMQQLYVLGKV